MPANDLVITITGVGFINTANFSYGLLIDSSNVVPDLPDLVVTDVESSSASPLAGETVTLSATIANIGTEDSFLSGLVKFYLSFDGTLDNARLLKSTSIGRVNQGSTSTPSTSVTMPTDLAPGSYSIIAVADGAHEHAELREDNNVSSPLPITIRVPPPSLSITTSHGGIYEGDEGFTDFTFQVTRTGNLFGASSVQWAVSGTTVRPADATDFGGTLPSGTINFSQNQALATITVRVNGDETVEPTDVFSVILSSPTNAVIASSTVNGYILNDDGSTMVDYRNEGPEPTFLNLIQYQGQFDASTDGNFILFQSTGNYFTPGGAQIYVRDMRASTTTLVSQNTAGDYANNYNFMYANGLLDDAKSLSGDGRYAIWNTAATNLVPGGAPGLGNPILRDLQAGTTTLLLPGESVSRAAFLDGGHSVIYASSTNHPEFGDTDGISDYYVLNIDTGQKRFLGTLSPGPSLGTFLDSAGDGRWLLTFAGEDRSGHLCDSLTATDSVVFTSQQTDNDDLKHAAISGNGKYVAFTSSSNLLPGDTANRDVYLKNLTDGSLTLISKAANGGQSDGPSYMVDVSFDGRFVFFISVATNLVPGETLDMTSDFYVRDVVLGQTVQLFKNVVGRTLVSPDGHYAFDLALHFFRTENPLWVPIVVGSSLGETLVGSAAAETVYGLAGDDVLSGLGGNDTIDGDAGTDAMAGGLGDDTYIIDTFLDVISENAGEGTDSVVSSASYIAHANIEIVTLTGTAGNGVIGNDLANVITGNAGNNGMTGGLGNDSISGGDGSDTISGEGGDDQMAGGSGIDIYFVDSAGDVVTEDFDGGTYDIAWTTVTMTLPANVEIIILNGGILAIDATGNDGASHTTPNLMLGNNAANRLTTFGGDDIILGLDGDDVIVAGGGTANGYDLISGGRGADTLTGGGGHDFFSFEQIDQAGDVITDFTTAGGANLDILDLRSMFPTFTNTAGITTSAQAVASGHLTFTQAGANTQVFADVNGGANNNVLLATISNTTAANVQALTLI